MRIALIGAAGQLGADLRTALPGQVVPLTHADIELSDAGSVASALDRVGPDCVVNAAAYTLVDKAEDEPEVAFAVNALGPRHLAEWCRRSGALLVHFSTDYVFSGAGAENPPRPFREDDLPDPGSVYAVSKLAGEHFVRAGCPRHVVLRTCGLYGHHATAAKGNFVETMLRLGRERMRAGEPLAIVDDHVCTPTSTADLAAVTARLLATSRYGLFHATNSGNTTWRGFAEEIFRIEQLPVAVKPISSPERPRKARRPSYSVLDGTRMGRILGGLMPPWEDALRRYLAGRPSRIPLP